MTRTSLIRRALPLALAASLVLPAAAFAQQARPAAAATTATAQAGTGTNLCARKWIINRIDTSNSKFFFRLFANAFGS